GAFGAVVLGRLRTDATRGFLAFTAFCASIFGLLAYLSDTALPATVPGSAIIPDPAFDQPRRLALILFTVLAFAYGVAIARSSRWSCRGPRCRRPARARWNRRPACSTSTSGRSPRERSSRPVCISAPECSCDRGGQLNVARRERTHQVGRVDRDYVEATSPA